MLALAPCLSFGSESILSFPFHHSISRLAAIDVRKMIRESDLGTERVTVQAHKRQDLAGQMFELMQGLVDGCGEGIERRKVLEVLRI